VGWGGWWDADGGGGAFYQKKMEEPKTYKEKLIKLPFFFSPRGGGGGESETQFLQFVFGCTSRKTWHSDSYTIRTEVINSYPRLSRYVHLMP